MPSFWEGIAIGIGVVAIGLTLVDHHVMWKRINSLADRLRQWEGWGRLVCMITADAHLEIPDPPPSIDGDGTKVRV